MKILSDYVKIRVRLKILEELEKNQKKRILSYMQKNNEKTIEIGDGTFSLYPDRRWEYSDEFKEQIKTLQGIEQESDRAKVKETERIRFSFYKHADKIVKISK